MCNTCNPFKKCWTYIRCIMRLIYSFLRNTWNFWSDSTSNWVQHSRSEWDAEILDKHKENSNSTQVKFLGALRSSGVLVKNRLTWVIFRGLMTEKSLMTDLLWCGFCSDTAFFMCCTVGMMGRDCGDLSCLHGFHHCCTCQGPSPPIPLARTGSKLFNFLCPWVHDNKVYWTLLQ